MYHLLAQQNNPQRPFIVMALNEARELLELEGLRYDIDDVLPGVIAQMKITDQERNKALDLHQRMRFVGDV